MEMPSAVCISDLENSAPVISQTGAFCGREAAHERPASTAGAFLQDPDAERNTSPQGRG